MPGEGSDAVWVSPTVGPEGPGVAGSDGDYSAARRANRLRRAGMVLVSIVVVLGAATVWGVRSDVARTQAGPLELTVRHAAVSRGGLATPWSVEVRRDGGFDGPVRLAVTSSFLDAFDENGLDPDPAASTSTAEEVLWEFDPPPGDVLTVSFDARVEPAAMGRRKGTVAVLAEDGERLVETSFTMLVLP